MLYASRTWTRSCARSRKTAETVDACEGVSKLDAVVGAHIETNEQFRLALQMLASVASGQKGLRRLWFAYSAPAEHRSRFDTLIALKLQRLQPSFDWKVLGVDGHESQFVNINRAIDAMASDPPDGVITGDADDLWGKSRAAHVQTRLQQGVLSSGCDVALMTGHVALVACQQPQTVINSTSCAAELAKRAECITTPSEVDEMLCNGDAHIKSRKSQVEHYEWLYAYGWLRATLAELDLVDIYTDMRLVQAAIDAHHEHAQTISFEGAWSYFWRPASNAVAPSHVSTVGPAALAPNSVIARARKLHLMMQRLKATPKNRWADYTPESAFVHAISTMHRQTRMQLAIPRWSTVERSRAELLGIVGNTSATHQTILSGERRGLPMGLLMAICCAKDFHQFTQFSNDDWSRFVLDTDTSNYTGFTHRSVKLLAQCVLQLDSAPGGREACVGLTLVEGQSHLDAFLSTVVNNTDFTNECEAEVFASAQTWMQRRNAGRYADYVLRIKMSEDRFDTRLKAWAFTTLHKHPTDDQVPTVMVLVALHTLRPFRRTGMARTLLHTVARLARSVGASSVALQCRPAMVDFYAKNGFKVNKHKMEGYVQMEMQCE